MPQPAKRKKRQGDAVIPTFLAFCLAAGLLGLLLAYI